jgi:amino acid adenylation domain-containing protein
VLRRSLQLYGTGREGLNGSFMAATAHIAEPRGEQARQYWRDRLTRFDGPTRLGRGIPAPGPKSVPLEQVRLAVSADGYQRLIETGYGDPASRYHVVLAALALCLHRFSGRSQVNLGAMSSAGAAWPGGAVPILLAISGAETFSGLVARVADEVRRATLAGPDALGEVMTEFGLAPRRGGPALFEVSCGVMDGGAPDGDAPGSVRLIVTEGDSGITGVLHFDPQELDVPQARAIRHQLVRLLEAAARHPELPVADITTLSPEEYHTVIYEWNRTAAPAGPERCVHRLVEAQVARQPAAIAVMAATGCYSYADLNRRANQLAHYLTDRLKVAPGDLIALAAERSFDLVVCALAVLKAGAAYLPLDPAYPPARLRLMLDDARPAAVLTLDRHRDALAGTAAPLLCIDTEAGRISSYPEENPDHAGNADSLLCVIYTSGTTGRPKGVMLTHRGVSNSLQWEKAAYQITADDRLLQLASWSFSLAIIETFSPLCAGATVVVAPAAASRDTSMISRLVGEYGITLLSVVPAELKLLLDTESGLPWTAIRRVITGADRLSRSVVDKYFATCPAVPLLNIYGQTESSMDGLCWICRPDEDSERVPVGRPVSNARAYILDADMRPVPVSVPGVLYCGGEGLARGYLGRPDLTADRFVPDPFGSAPGGRLCRSGDLARWRPDGVIELLGREDHQVQVAGARVELEEIESVLCEHPAVRDAAVAMYDMPDPACPGQADRAAWESLLSQLSPATIEQLLTAAEQVASGRPDGIVQR